MPSNQKSLSFEHEGKIFTKPWLSENQLAPPKKLMVVDDSFPAAQYIALASQGVSFVWKGDFHNSKQLLQAVQRRIKRHIPAGELTNPQSMAKEFYRYRQHQAYKAQLLSRLLICVEDDLSIQLPRAPDLREAIREAVNPKAGFLASLRELQGFVGAYEWRKKGVPIPALKGKKIHAHYGVFSPVRGEYLDLVAGAPLPQPAEIAFDIGTGTGVLSAILAERGISKIIATDLNERALHCARQNISHLGLEKVVSIQKTNLFPEGVADLIVCNPPWLPAKPTSSLERSIYDEDSRMTKEFLNGVASHLSEEGEAWLIISDLAEHLGLRNPHDLTSWISEGKLMVVDQMKTRPRHSKAEDAEDPLHAARSKEITTLWRMKKASAGT